MRYLWERCTICGAPFPEKIGITNCSERVHLAAISLEGHRYAFDTNNLVPMDREHRGIGLIMSPDGKLVSSMILLEEEVV